MASDSAPEIPVEDGPRLIPLGSHVGKPPFPLTRLATIIGSHKRCHLQLASSSVSKHHAVIVIAGDEAYVSDLGSRTKIKINGSEMRDGRLHDGDEIRIGKFLLKFATPSSAPPPTEAMTPTVIVDEAALAHPTPLDHRVLLIGSRPGADVVIEEAAVSGRHAILFTAGGKRYIRDLSSRTGTYLAGTRIRQQEVQPGDQIRIGGTTLHLELTNPFAPAASPPPAAAPDVPPAEALLPELAPPVVPEHTADEDLPALSPDEVMPEIDLTPPAPQPRPVVPPGTAEIAPEVLMDLGPTSTMMALAPSIPPRPALPSEPVFAPPPPVVEPATEPVAEAIAEPVAPVEADTADEIDLSKDPDVSGVSDGPGDTAVLKPAPPAPAIELSPPSSDSSKVAMPPALAADADLSPSKSPELSWPRRGWRGEPARPEPVSQSAPLPADLEPLPAEEIPSPVESIESASLPIDDVAPPDQALPPESAPIASAPIALEPEDISAAPEAISEVAPEPPKRGRPPKGSVQRKSVLNRTTAKRVPPPEPVEEIAAEAPPQPVAPHAPSKSPTPVAKAPAPPPYPEPDKAQQVAEIDFLNLKLDLKSADDAPPEKWPADETTTSDLVSMDSSPRASKSTEETDRPLIVGEEVTQTHSDSEIFDTTIRHDVPAPASARQPDEADEEPPIIGLEISLDDFPSPEIKKEPAAPAPSPAPPEEKVEEEVEIEEAQAEHEPEPELESELELGPELEPEPISGEVLDAADSQPGATLDLDLELPPMPEPSPEMVEPVAEMGDTAFGETVQALASQASGPLVEEPLAAIESEPTPIELPETELEMEPVAEPVAQVESPPPIAPDPPRPQIKANEQPRQPDAPLSSLAGTALFGIGAVNIDHFLGGMPFKLQAAPPPKPQPFSKTPINFEGSWSQPLGSSGIADDDGPDPIAHIPRLVPTPLPPEPKGERASTSFNMPFSSEKLEVTPPAADIDQPFSPAAGNRKEISSMAFDGLAMGSVVEKDVFSEFPAPIASSDTAFGGPAIEEPRPPQNGDPVFTQSPKSPGGPAVDVDKDFAEDDFWNRTDEEDGTPPSREWNPDQVLAPEGAAELEEFPPPPPVPRDAHAPAEGDEPLSAPEIESSEVTMESEAQPEAAEEIPQTAAVATTERPSRPKRRGLRWLIPFLMVAMLVSMAGAITAIRVWVPAHSSIAGSLTYLNFNWVQGTDDGNDFQARQQRLLASDQTRQRAIAILGQQHNTTSPGFLGDANLYLPVARSVSLTSQHSAGEPQTVITLTANGNDEAADRLRMSALLSAMIEANAPVVDENRRLRDVADRARHDADDTVDSLERTKKQISAYQHTVSEGPTADDFDALTTKKTQLQQTRFAAEDAVDEDRHVLAITQADQPASAAATARPADPLLTQLREQIDDFSAKLKAARNVQSVSVVGARGKLHDAMKQFGDAVSSAAGNIDSNSPLKPAVDAASDSQVKNQQTLVMLMADGEDFEKQLEDTRRDLEESIQGRQQQTWAADAHLQEMQAALDSAQHRYNASVGEGVDDPKILQPLQKEIDQRTAEIKARQAELAVDPGGVKVEAGLTKLIESLRGKLQTDLKQVAGALDPVDKQLATLNDSAAPLPQAQQKQAWQLRRRLAVVGDTRRQYAQAIAQVQITPSLNVTDLQQQIDELQARFDHRQLALADEMQKSTDPRMQKLAAAQKKLVDDKQTLAQAKTDYDAIRIEYDRQAGLREDARAAETKIQELSDVLVKQTAQVDAAVRDRDQKLAQADHLFDLKPLADADVVGTSNDPRWNYSCYAVAALAVIFAFAASHQAHRQSTEPQAGAPEPAPGDNIVTAEIVGDLEVDDEDDHEAAVV